MELENKKYQPVIGLEIHVQLKTQSKLFCSCSTKKDVSPNSNICPICMGHPGSMPSLNKKAVELAIKLGLATNCKINSVSTFDRKNYFYPDLPKGFQITQERIPLCRDGLVEFFDKKNGREKISIQRIHIEEDAGKLFHSENNSAVDFNRCGIPLLEIVTNPDFSSPEQTVMFLKQIKLILEYLDICDCDMQAGSLRVDVNLSVKNMERGINYPRTEIKNLNSFNNVKDALNYEFARQVKLIESENYIASKTLLWDEKTNQTIATREKISRVDYRFIPEPDIPNLNVSQKVIDNIKAELPELPIAKRNRIIQSYKIPHKKADVLVTSKFLAEYFEQVSKFSLDFESNCNWIIGEVLRLCNESKVTPKEIKLIPENLAQLIQLKANGKISNLNAKIILEKIFTTNESPLKVAEKLNLLFDDDKKAIEKYLQNVLSEQSDKVKQYKTGKTSLLGYFIGLVVKQSEGKADPKVVRQKLLEKLNS